MDYYIKKQTNQAVCEPQVFSLPFSYENVSFGANVSFDELKKAGFVKYIASDMSVPPLKVLDHVEYIALSDDEGSFKPILRNITEKEQEVYFGAQLDLDGWKTAYIKAFNEYANLAYQKYLSKYPELEQSSFSQKANEAFKVKTNENTPLNETPFLTFLAGENLEARNALAQAVITKVAYITKFESFCVEKRDAIKACNSLEEIRDITIDLSDFL